MGVRGLVFILFLAVPASGYCSLVPGADLPVSDSGSISSPNYRLSPLPGQGLSDGQADSTAIALLGGSYPPLLVERLFSKRVSGFVLDGANIWVSMSGSGIMRSTDSGATWAGATTQPANRRIKGLIINPKNRTELFAISYGSGVFTSTDSGDSWVACTNTGLSGAALNGLSIAIDPAGALYSGTEAGIFKSSDCSSWSAISSLPVNAAAPPVALAINPAAPAKIYTGLDGAGIFRSSDSGDTWAPAATQPANLKIRALAVAPGDGARLYAATSGSGVFFSTDRGATWRACANEGLANLNVQSLLVNDNNKLYAGTERGLFISDDNCASWATLLGKGPQ